MGPIDPIDPRLVAALAEQLERRRQALAGGAHHVGWKLGMGDRESIGGEIAVGHLTSASVLASGDAFPAGGAQLHADAELAVELGADGAIARYAVAIELVDLARLDGEPESVVVENVFHRAVAFGPWSPEPPGGDGRLIVGSDVRATGRVPAMDDRLAAAARLLDTAGERFRAGDRVITGSIVQAPVAAGELAAAEIDGLGSARLAVL